MREALDEVGEEVGRYIRLCNYSSGMCMHLKLLQWVRLKGWMLCSTMLFTEYCSETSTCREHWLTSSSREDYRILRYYIQLGRRQLPDYRRCYESAYTVLASQLINEQFAVLANVKEEHMGSSCI